MKEKEYSFFSRRIQRLARKERFPIRAMFELTYRCNFQCVHCYNTDEQKNSKEDTELKTKEIFNILYQLKEMGGFYLGFTGGEIFCRKDILDILWYARKLGFELILFTNGSLITPRIAGALRYLKPNKVDITVHAMKKNIFGKITGVPHLHNAVFRAIDLLHARNIAFALKSCGMQQNKEEIPKIKNFARKLHTVYTIHGELTPRMDRTKDNVRHSLSTEEVYSLQKSCNTDVYNISANKNEIAKKLNSRRRNLKRLFNCDAGFTHLTISPYGELKTCIMIDYPKYNILTGSLSEGWQQIKDFVDNLKPPPDWGCYTCDLAKYCFWCPARGYLEDGSFDTCSLSYRKEVKFMEKMLTKR